MNIRDQQDPASILPADATAPDFRLPASTGEEIQLSTLRGTAVILAFYPADWSPVCGDQMTLYNEVLPMFEDYGGRLLGISVDGAWSHRAFADARNLRFPLISDFEPKGAVARAYGVYRQEQGTAARALFVIDPEGMIVWSYLSPPGINPGAEGILQALERIAHESGQEVFP
jgi:peroxiredoxin